MHRAGRPRDFPVSAFLIEVDRRLQPGMRFQVHAAVAQAPGRLLRRFDELTGNSLKAVDEYTENKDSAGKGKKKKKGFF